MLSLTFHLELPDELAGKIDPADSEVAARLRETLVVELVRRTEISTGKGAELLGLSKSAFRALLCERGIPYFRISPEELAEELEASRLAELPGRQ